MRLKHLISFVITPAVVVILLLFADLEPGKPEVTRTFCIALLMAVWWITGIVPLAVTSLLPVALFPLLGVMDGKTVSAAYFNDVIFLFMGGFLVALAMERWNLHRRIALKILSTTGVKPSSILLGFMLASFFLSMWISNTATAMMMLPIAMSVIAQIEHYADSPNAGKFSIGLLLSIAYAASIGGMATLVGTPPNLSFARIFHIYFPNAPEITFSSWLLFAFPASIVLFMLAWIVLYFMYRPDSKHLTGVTKSTFHDELRSMGKASQEEKIVFVVFLLLAILWIFRTDLDIGLIRLRGWSGFFPQGGYINDGTVAIAMAVILFLIPSKTDSRTRLLDWPTAAKLPWHILLLFGGGFALATGFKESGLSLWFGEQLTGVSKMHPLAVILFVSLIITFLTELTSNTATIEMVLPVLAGLAITSGIHPLLLMIPATLSASMAFMMPVATPPNAIIFGTSRITVGQMARTGLILNLAGAVVITMMMYYWGDMVFNVHGSLPEWVTNH
ncbi:MAG TPA: SLC13 family permease [Bacteroidales bacterium]|nr:SLC13 family permease [Bacteroidales bacterium]